MNNPTNWTAVGHRGDLAAGAGVGARVGQHQLALFWLPELAEMEGGLFAVSNYCPFSQVNIIARGIVGDVEGEPIVASPLYKQHFSLRDGHCLEKPDVSLETWLARLHGDEIQVSPRPFPTISSPAG